MIHRHVSSLIALAALLAVVLVGLFAAAQGEAGYARFGLAFVAVQLGLFAGLLVAAIAARRGGAVGH